MSTDSSAPTGPTDGGHEAPPSRPAAAAGPNPRTAKPVRIRRAPRFASFITTGVLVGLVVAVVVALVQGAGAGWPLLFLAATAVLVGAVLGGVLAVVADRRSR